MGEVFIVKTFEKHSCMDENDSKYPFTYIIFIGILISFEGIIEVILKFQYICTTEDRGELRTWLFNNHLIVTAPKYYDRNTIFVDLENLIKKLKEETKVEYPHSES